MAFVRLMVSELLFLGKGQIFILSLLDLPASIHPRTSGQQLAPGLWGFTLIVGGFGERCIQTCKFRLLNCENSYKDKFYLYSFHSLIQSGKEVVKM